jgi:tetratricopeptide (TPR) repeat protein
VFCSFIPSNERLDCVSDSHEDTSTSACRRKGFRPLVDRISKDKPVHPKPAGCRQICVMTVIVCDVKRKMPSQIKRSCIFYDSTARNTLVLAAFIRCPFSLSIYPPVAEREKEDREAPIKVFTMCACRIALELLSLFVFLVFSLVVVNGNTTGLSAEDYLSLANDALSSTSSERAIDLYLKGLSALKQNESLLTALSLETNLASAYSSIGDNTRAINHYQRAISSYEEQIGLVDKQKAEDAKSIVSQSSFFLGMVLQDEGEATKAVDAYSYAAVLDPQSWAALANLGSVLHDQLGNHDGALEAYNNAYGILTESENPTDAPEEPRYILSQLQYRIGLCLTHNPERKCAVVTEPAKEVSCKEMATHAFSLAVRYDPTNESANHMLAAITADATMQRASNTYVKNLFDDYAQK